MTLVSRLIDLILLSLRDPAAALSALRRTGATPRESWQAILVAASVGAVLSWLVLRIMPPPEPGAMSDLAGQPIVMAALQVAAAGLFAVLMARVGRIFGGTGLFTDALLATAWIEIAMLAIQIPQLLLSVLLPPLGGLVGLLTFALYFVLAVQMTRAVHGFRSPLIVAVGLLGTVFVAGFVLSVMAAMLGILPEGPA